MPDIKNKKELIYIIFITGIALLFIGRLDMKPKEEGTPVIETEKQPELEQRLKAALRMVEGVGEVEVVINYGSSEAKIIAKDKTEETNETTKRFEEKVVLGSDSRPVVLRENSPEIQGVLIVAQGGGNAAVKSALISAAQALLGVEAHKIEVLKMK